jgi:hypothetical protein
LSVTSLTGWVFITEVESVYRAVGAESLHNTDTFRPLRINVHIEETMFLIADISAAVNMGSNLWGEDSDWLQTEVVCLWK